MVPRRLRILEGAQLYFIHCFALQIATINTQKPAKHVVHLLVSYYNTILPFKSAFSLRIIPNTRRNEGMRAGILLPYMAFLSLESVSADYGEIFGRPSPKVSFMAYYRSVYADLLGPRDQSIPII